MHPVKPDEMKENITRHVLLYKQDQKSQAGGLMCQTYYKLLVPLSKQVGIVRKKLQLQEENQ